MTADGDRVVFETLRKGHGAEIWGSDGTVAGTYPLLELPAGFGFGDTPHRLGGRWIFPAGPVGVPVLWTAGAGFTGAAPLAGCAGGCPTFQGFAAPPDGGSQLFAGEDADHGTELWSTDGTAAGTRRLTDACPGACSGLRLSFDPTPGALQTVIPGLPGSAWFHAFPSADADATVGDELWFTDGTAGGTRRVAGHTMDVGFLGSQAFYGRFNGRNPASELWTATGAAGGARRAALLRRFAPGSAPQLVPFQGGALLLPGDPADAGQIWRSDGTPAGTVPFFSFTPGSGRSFYTLFPSLGPVQLAVVLHQEGHRQSNEIWRTDGTSHGTRPLLQLDPRQVLYLDTTPWDGKILFNVGDPEGCAFWSSDGTAAGTRQILPPMSKLDCTGSLVAFGSRFVFVAGVGARPDHRTPQIFISDGTPAGTHQLTVFQEIVSPVFDDRPVVVGGVVFLRLNDTNGNPEIWRTDGTPGHTRRAFPLTDADNLFAFGGLLYFTAVVDDNTGRSGVFRASSSDRSPTLLAAIDRLEVDSRTVSFTPLGDRLVFAASDPDHGSELWITDGTPAGAHLLADLDPGPRSSIPTGFVPAGDRVFFSADDGTHGLELWETDGTTEGTRRLTDIAPGGFSSLLRYSSNPIVSNGFLFFNADDAVTGTEPWALPLEPR